MLLSQILTLCFLMLHFPICCFDNLAQKHSYGLEKVVVFFNLKISCSVAANKAENSPSLWSKYLFI